MLPLTRGRTWAEEETCTRCRTTEWPTTCRHEEGATPSDEDSGSQTLEQPPEPQTWKENLAGSKIQAYYRVPWVLPLQRKELKNNF